MSRSSSTPEPQGLTRRQAALKRAFDLACASTGLAALSWVIGPTWLLATLDTRQNGFFTQTRVGRHGRPFKVVKLRTMRASATVTTTVTTGRDPRITRLGRLLRRSKLDELPQLFNVVLGDMSLVGPRPDVPGFADVLEGEDRLMLTVRPGITGPAQLRWRDEETVLAAVADPEAYNRDVIFPDKVRVNVDYVRSWSFASDVAYILKTVVGDRGDAPDAPTPRSAEI